MSKAKDKDCIFCKIIKSEIPTKYLFNSDNLIVVNDIKPSAEKHILLIPKLHIPTFEDLKEEHNEMFLEMKKVAQRFIKDLQIRESYKLIFNGGKFLEVEHLHWHLMGGEIKKH